MIFNTIKVNKSFGSRNFSSYWMINRDCLIKRVKNTKIISFKTNNANNGYKFKI